MVVEKRGSAVLPIIVGCTTMPLLTVEVWSGPPTLLNEPTVAEIGYNKGAFNKVPRVHRQISRQRNK